MENCPCGSKKPFLQCCNLFITQAAQPSTPEQLMRSRYTAYTLSNMDYIEQTMRGPALFDFDPASAKKWSESVHWLGLKVLKSNAHHDKGFVEFIASFEHQGKKQKIHETSQFSRIEGKWYYLQGKNHLKS